MPVYKKKEIVLRITSERQMTLMIQALETAYRNAEPKEKIILSKVLSKFEK